MSSIHQPRVSDDPEIARTREYSPTEIPPGVAEAICERMCKAESLRSICRDPSMPPRSVIMKWIIGDVNGFHSQYTHARDVGLDQMADETLEISDTAVEAIVEEYSDKNGRKITKSDAWNHRRLQIDTRKWYLSKLAPKKYGDKIEHEVHGEVTVVEALLRARRRTGQDGGGSE